MSPSTVIPCAVPSQNCLPSKSVESHMKLRFVLLFSMDFRTEITEQQSQELLSTAVGKSRFVEELRRQFVLEYDDYFNEVWQCPVQLHLLFGVKKCWDKIE